MPITYITFLIATLAISGVPLTSGFLSKDGILAGSLAFGSLSGHWFIPFAGFAAALMTAFYMFRLLIEAFHGQPKTDIAKHTHENKWTVTMPLIVLALLSFWFIYSPNPIDPNDGWFLHKIQTPANVVPAEYQYDFITPLKDTPVENGGHAALNVFEEALHHAHIPAMFMSLAIAGIGILLAYLIYQWKKFNADKIANAISPLYKLSYNKWYFDEIYNKSIIGGTLALSKLLSLFDNKIVDGLVNLSAKILRAFSWVAGRLDNWGVDGLVNLTAWVVGLGGRIGRKMQTGSVQTYIAFSIIILMVVAYFIM
jgi:NADH-quinone oxidoreductase subunit L